MPLGRYSTSYACMCITDMVNAASTGEAPSHFHGDVSGAALWFRPEVCQEGRVSRQASCCRAFSGPPAPFIPCVHTHSYCIKAELQLAHEELMKQAQVNSGKCGTDGKYGKSPPPPPPPPPPLPLPLPLSPLDCVACRWVQV